MAACSPGISIVFLLGIKRHAAHDSFYFAARRQFDVRVALLHFPNELVAIERVESNPVRKKQSRLDLQAEVDVNSLGALGQVGGTDFSFKLRILRGLFSFGFVRGIPIDQRGGNFFPLRALDAPVPHAVALHGIFARQLKRSILQNQFFALGERNANGSRGGSRLGVRILACGKCAGQAE